MRFITVAVRCEASPIIERFALKKETSTGKFDVYSSDENTLVISGAGPTNAAIATSYLLSRQGCNNLDTSVNIGICGTADKSIAIGTPLLCNRVIDHSTRREYYPDIVFKHRLAESSVETYSHPVDPNTNIMSGTLADMEASGFMAAVSRFLNRDNAICIKIVSDNLEPAKPGKTFISGIIKNSLDMVEEVLAAKDMVNNKIYSVNNGFTRQERELLKKVSSVLMLSEAMKIKLEKLARYHLLRTGSLSLLDEYASVNTGSRKEGKEYFSEIESRIVQTALHPGIL